MYFPQDSLWGCSNISTYPIDKMPSRQSRGQDNELIVSTYRLFLVYVSGNTTYGL